MEKLKIVFMGTPEFAVGILDTICQTKHEVVGVITVADKPSGRGQKVNTSAVKDYALKNNLKLLQPTNLKDETFLNELQSLNANLFVVVAFRMLPEVVWKMPKLGTFNLHASLLPQYRGAAPINWAIINGEEKTGVTTFFIDEKIDTGAMILQTETLIDKNETAGELHDRLMTIGSQTVIETLDLIEKNTVTPKQQDDSLISKTAYKLNKDNCKIDWNKNGIEVHNHIRGLSPYPAAWTQLKDGENEWNIKVYQSEFIPEEHNYTLRSVLTTKKELKIAVKNGFLLVKELQFPGKKKMKTYELLNGIQLSSNTLVI